MSPPVVGKGRAVDCSTVRTWAGVKLGWAENIKPTVAATKGELKLVPTVMSKPSDQPDVVGPCKPLLVAAKMGYRQASPLPTLTQLPPGAAMLIWVPRSEKPTLVPTWRKAVTPITPVQLAGTLTGPPALLPAAATMTTPLAMISFTALW